MSRAYIVICVALMAILTYIVRAVPLLVFRKKIRNKYIYSFLNYIPYAILTALIVPGILYSTKSAVSPDSIASTENIITACFGALVAFVLAFLNRSLIVVAVSATTAVFVLQLILGAV